MEMSKCTAITITIAAVCGLLAAPASGDWDPNDPHKMHYPQLPDPRGWDVEISSMNPQHECADDWRCSSSGAVSDIHFWYSVSHDGGTRFDWLVVTIYDDDQSGSFSKPGNGLWSRTFPSSEFTVVDPAGTGLQGFADPQQPWWDEDNHETYQQLNIENIPDPFFQEQGTIYWLGLYGCWEDGPQEPVGWKTTLSKPFADAAVYRDLRGGWQPLDPFFQDHVPERLDFAFVITPEPSTLSLLTLCGLAVMRRRRR
jgi:hypothetical protein